MKFIFNTQIAHDFSERISDFVQRFPEHSFVIVKNKAELTIEIQDAHVLIGDYLDRELLDAAKTLEWLLVPYTGINRIPLDELTARGIRVSNNHGNGRIVAERALALALAIMGRIPEFDKDLRQGDWHRNDSRDNPFQFWTTLFERKITIIGMGTIGLTLAGLLSVFTSNITGFRRTVTESSVPGFNRVTDNLTDALNGCEVCFVTLPLTPATLGLIGEDELMKCAGGYLVNVSRGDIVAEEPLYRMLRNGTLAGAAIDTWYSYPKSFTAKQLPSKFAFHQLNNLVLSPHAGSNTVEGKIGQLEGVLENITALIDTGFPKNVINPKTGY